jgi:hypothetical protein
MRFNFLKRKLQQTTNHEGARAYTITPEAELYAAVVTSSLSDGFYEGSGERVARIRELIGRVDAAFVAKLAIYTRTSMHMRSIPLVLAVELAKSTSGNGLVAKTVRGTVKRADEITELLAYYQAANMREGVKKLNKLSKQIQKGLADAFNGFDEYQFAKYNKDTAVRLRDALFLVHPRAKDEGQQALFNKIANNTLAVPYTWETELSAAGKAARAQGIEKTTAMRQAWEQMIDSNRLGYMATLRNLRNMLQAGVSAQHMVKVCNYLSDHKAVAGSKQLPFRFLSAYREIQWIPGTNTQMCLYALEQAIGHSAANLSGFGRRSSVLIACDVSGSMQQAVSAGSSVQLFDIGLVLGMLLQSKCARVVTGIFGTYWKEVKMPSRNILNNVMAFKSRAGEVGYGTNGHLVIQDLLIRGVKIDKVMMFTDFQLWDSRHGGDSLQHVWTRYRKFHPEAKLYLFDLAGYGTTPVSMKDDGVCLIAGWSDKVFDVLVAIEDGQDILNKIKEIEL